MNGVYVYHEYSSIVNCYYHFMCTMYINEYICIFFSLSLYLSVSVIIIFQCLLLVLKSFSCVSVALLFFLIFLLSCVCVWCHNKRNTHETCMDVRTRATADINHISIVKCVVRVWVTQRYVKNKDAQFIHKNFLRSHAVRCSLFIHYALHDFFLSFFCSSCSFRMHLVCA